MLSPPNSLSSSESLSSDPQSYQSGPQSYRDLNVEVSAQSYQLSERKGQSMFLSPAVYDPVAGVPVNADTAMTHSAVYRCVSLIAASVASCRAGVYREDRQTRKIEQVFDHPAHYILNRSPDFSSGLTPYTFFENLIVQYALLGDGFAQVDYNGRQQGVSCVPLPYHWVTPEWDDNGNKIYKVHTDGYYSPLGKKRKPDEILEVDEVVHLADLLNSDFLRGQSRVKRMAQEVSLGLASTRHSARYFRHGRPLGFISVKEYLNKTSKMEFQNDWEEMHKTPWSVGVLANEAKWIPLSLSAAEVQLLETREFQIADIARFFGVPTFLLGLANKEGYKSAEQLFRSFVTSTLGPLVMKLEQELRLKLFTRDESYNYFVKFDMDDLQRGDTQAMSEALERQVRHGLLLVNEYRRKMNRPDVEYGDVPLSMASQLATLEDVVKGTANLGKGSSTAPGAKTSPSDGKSSSSGIIATGDDRVRTVLSLLQQANSLLASQVA